MTDFIDLSHGKQYKYSTISVTRFDFKLLFRFEKENVQWLANKFLGSSQETRGGALSSLHKMKICIGMLPH